MPCPHGHACCGKASQRRDDPAPQEGTIYAATGGKVNPPADVKCPGNGLAKPSRPPLISTLTRMRSRDWRSRMAGALGLTLDAAAQIGQPTLHATIFSPPGPSGHIVEPPGHDAS